MTRAPGITAATFRSFRAGCGWASQAFRNPIDVLTARTLEDVVPVLDAADRASRQGKWAVVVLAYEAAAAFEPAIGVLPAADWLPLACVSVFDGPVAAIDVLGVPGPAGDPPAFQPQRTRDWFEAAVLRVQEHIREGDTYQVNLTFPLSASWVGDPHVLFARLGAAQQAGYCAYLECGAHTVLSLSPELFFERIGPLVRARPMKGTAARGRWLEDDRGAADALHRSEKNRAENVMIVDLLRNDIGRRAVPGTVRVDQLFAVERYPTLWQMTSTVEGEVPASRASLVDLLRALFPCGSVTGAPKIRTMQIIRDVEASPRGLYTGTIGCVAPGGDCAFNVVIRTIVLDQHAGIAALAVGAGITADSHPGREYEESLLKASFAGGVPRDPAHGRATQTPLLARPDTFELLETILLEDGRFWLLRRHLRRMRASAEFFGFAFETGAVLNALAARAHEHPAGRWRVRLLLDLGGRVRTEAIPTPMEPDRIRRVSLAEKAVDSRDLALFHKTTARDVYRHALEAAPGVDDVVLWNERGEVTESSIANVVVKIDGRLLTPARSSGLLAGTLRAELLATNVIVEAVVRIDDLLAANRVWLINSVQGWMRAEVQR